MGLSHNLETMQKNINLANTEFRNWLFAKNRNFIFSQDLFSNLDKIMSDWQKEVEYRWSLKDSEFLWGFADDGHSSCEVQKVG